jgi:pimeloyl-ACP methyl ester carboxylesterase
VVIVHGKDSSRSAEFDGCFVDLGAALQRGGFNVLMIDLRGHGQSGNGRYSFGLNERRDIQGAVDWLSAKGLKPGSIGVLGVSFGAASAIGAMAEDRRIGALVIDSGFADFRLLLEKHWSEQTGLPHLLLPPMLLMSRLLVPDLCTARPIGEIGRIASRAVLLIHSEDDQLVPVEHFEQLKAAAPFADTWLVSGVEHARIFNANPEAYSNRVISFFDRNLGK